MCSLSLFYLILFFPQFQLFSPFLVFPFSSALSYLFPCLSPFFYPSTYSPGVHSHFLSLVRSYTSFLLFISVCIFPLFPHSLFPLSHEIFHFSPFPKSSFFQKLVCGLFLTGPILPPRAILLPSMQLNKYNHLVLSKQFC